MQAKRFIVRNEVFSGTIFCGVERFKTSAFQTSDGGWCVHALACGADCAKALRWGGPFSFSGRSCFRCTHRYVVWNTVGLQARVPGA